MRSLVAALVLLLGAPVAAAQAAGVADGVPVSGSPGVASAELVATGLGALPTPSLDHEKAIEEGHGEDGAEERDREEAGREGDVAGPGNGEGGRLAHPAANPDAPPTPRPLLLQRTGGRIALTSSFGFNGPTLSDSGAFPPDTQGDVGPTQYIVAINGRFRSYNKATGVADGALNADSDVFFNSVMTPPTGSNFTSDPHIRYDRLSHRWYIVMIDVPGGSGNLPNRYLLAVSSGPTIVNAASWTYYQWSEDLAGGADGQFADYPTLGIDQNALYIGGNMFGAASGAYTGSRAYVVRKSSVTGGGPIVVTKFTTGDAGSGLFTPQGVDDRSGTSSVGWFAATDQANFSIVNFLKVSNPGGTPTLSGPVAVSVPATAFPAPVPHQGNTGGTNGRIDALDDRLFSANLRSGHIWTAHNIGVTSAGVADTNNPSRDATRWYDFDVSSGTPTLNQSGTVFDPAASNPLNYTIPTTNINGQGIVAMGGTVAGAASFINTWFTSRKPSDAAGAMDTPTVATAASAAYNPSGDTGGSSGRRWGDYSFVSVDPDDDMTMWSIQEFTASANVWGTRITKLKAPAPAATTTAPAKLTIGPAVSHITIAGSGFFDPGAAFPNRLAVTSNCGATATVTSVTATAVAADVVAPGSGTCTFTVTNPDGQSTASSSAVPVTNHAPAAVADNGTTAEDTALDGASVLGNDTDADSDTLTATLATPPAHGTVTVAPSGTYHYVPAAGYSGSDSFTYTASDGFASSAPATVSLTVTHVNHAPVAVGDSGSVVQNASLTQSTSVLANDSDQDGDALTAVLVANVAHGSLSLASSGTYTYTPAAGYAGPDSFTYKASDGSLFSNTVTVSLTVDPLNHAPVAVADSGDVAQDTVLHGTSVLANDTDQDADQLNAVLGTTTAHGALSLAADGSYTYTPAVGYVGGDTFTYRANDGTLSSGLATVSLTVHHVNHAPVANGDTGTTPHDTMLIGSTVLANDTDPDGDSLTAAVATGPAHGSLTLDPNGSYVYVPAAGYSGSDAFTYTAGDGLATSAPATVSLTITPAPGGTTTTPTSTTPTLRPGTAPACTIPAVKGITSTKAKAKLAAAGCTAVTVKRVRSTMVRPNRSLQTVPAAGTAVKAATPVVLQVTYPLCKVPSVKGLTLAKAKERLKAAACFKVTVNRVAGGRSGRVAKTSPRAGKTVKASGRVTVSVGR